MMDALFTYMVSGNSPMWKFVKGDEMYRSLLRHVADLQRGIRAAADTTSDLGKALYSDAMHVKVSEPLRDLDQRLARMQSGQGPLGQFLRDDAQYLQLRNSVAEVRKTVAE